MVKIIGFVVVLLVEAIYRIGKISVYNNDHGRSYLLGLEYRSVQIQNTDFISDIELILKAN